MNHNALFALASQIDELYARCIRSAICEAMTAAFGSEAFAEFVRIDTEHTKKTNLNNQKTGKKLITPLIQNQKSFDDFDVQACSKTLLYLPKVRDQILDYFHMDPANGAIMQKLNQPLRSLILERNSKKHTEGRLESQLLKDCARNEILVVETLFPSRADPSEPHGLSYLQQMEAAYAGFLTEQITSRYAVTDYVDPQVFDLSSFFAVCMQLKLRSEMEEGERYFFSSDLEKDVARLKNSLPKRAAQNDAAMPAAAWMPPPAAETQPWQQAAQYRQTPQIQPTGQSRQEAAKRISGSKGHGPGKLLVILLGCLAVVLAIVLIVLLATMPKSVGLQASGAANSFPAAQQAERTSEAQITEPEPSTILADAATSTPAPTPSATVPVQTTEATEQVVTNAARWKSFYEVDHTTVFGDHTNVEFTIDQAPDNKIVIHYSHYVGRLTLGWVSAPTVTPNYEDGRKAPAVSVYTSKGTCITANNLLDITQGSGEFYVLIEDIDGLVSLTIHNAKCQGDNTQDITIPLNN